MPLDRTPFDRKEQLDEALFVLMGDLTETWFDEDLTDTLFDNEFD